MLFCCQCFGGMKNLVVCLLLVSNLLKTYNLSVDHETFPKCCTYWMNVSVGSHRGWWAGLRDSPAVWSCDFKKNIFGAKPILWYLKILCLHRLEICWKNCRYRFSKEMYICHWTRLQVKDLIIPRQRKWRSVKECPSFVLWSVQHYQLVCQRFPWNFPEMLSILYLLKTFAKILPVNDSKFLWAITLFVESCMSPLR